MRIDVGEEGTGLGSGETRTVALNYTRAVSAEMAAVRMERSGQMLKMRQSQNKQDVETDYSL